MLPYLRYVYKTTNSIKLHTYIFINTVFQNIFKCQFLEEVMSPFWAMDEYLSIKYKPMFSFSCLCDLLLPIVFFFTGLVFWRCPGASGISARWNPRAPDIWCRCLQTAVQQSNHHTRRQDRFDDIELKNGRIYVVIFSLFSPRQC